MDFIVCEGGVSKNLFGKKSQEKFVGNPCSETRGASGMTENKVLSISSPFLPFR